MKSNAKAGAKAKAKVKAPPAEERYRAPALDKGLDILELFVEEDSPLALSEVARKLDRSVGEIFRMVMTLERRGYLMLDPDTDQYRLSLKMFRLSHRHAPIRQLAAASAGLLKQFTREVRQSAHITVPHSGRGLIVVQQDSPTNRGFRVRLGAELALTTTCSGLVILANLEDGERARQLALAEAIEGADAEAHDVLERQIAAVAARGYYQVKSSYTKGVTDVGCPIFGYSGEFKGALTVPFLGRIDKNQIDIAAVRAELVKAAAKISENLGYDPQ